MSDEIAKTSKSGEVSSWIFLALAILYDVSPVDIIPDIPVIGWIDDFFVTAVASLNVIQKTLADSVMWLSQIAKILKWLTIGVGAIVILLILLLGALIIKLFTS
jgi:uncharacterized membrane protein YkvA (DUF1232 family)